MPTFESCALQLNNKGKATDIAGPCKIGMAVLDVTARSTAAGVKKWVWGSFLESVGASARTEGRLGAHVQTSRRNWMYATPLVWAHARPNNTNWIDCDPPHFLYFPVV